jgi:hypothetical protein
MFGELAAGLGRSRCAVTEFQYLAVPLPNPATAPGVTVVPCVDGVGSGLFDLAVRARGRAYAVAEELDQEDLLLDRLDQRYRALGLRRYRRVWLAYGAAGPNGTIGPAGQHRPIGAAIAYRGPLGFNLSFLENRCDLLLDPALAADRAVLVGRALVGAAAPTYADSRRDGCHLRPTRTCRRRSWRRVPPRYALETAIAGLATTGFDPFVGRRLFGLARAAGLVVRDVRVEQYHLIAGRVDEPTRRLWELKLDIAQPAARALGSRRAAEALRTRFLAYLDREDTLTWSHLFTVCAQPVPSRTG